jgi:hypothetical protein
MENKALQTINVFRWIARIISAIVVALFLLIFIGEISESYRSASSNTITSFDTLQLTLMCLGVFGLIAAWIWELYGGILAFLAFLGLFIIHPSIIVSPLIIYPLNALVFMILWWFRFRHRNDEAEV